MKKFETKIFFGLEMWSRIEKFEDNTNKKEKPKYKITEDNYISPEEKTLIENVVLAKINWELKKFLEKNKIDLWNLIIELNGGIKFESDPQRKAYLKSLEKKLLSETPKKQSKTPKGQGQGIGMNEFPPPVKNEPWFKWNSNKNSDEITNTNRVSRTTKQPNYKTPWQNVTLQQNWWDWKELHINKKVK